MVWAQMPRRAKSGPMGFCCCFVAVVVGPALGPDYGPTATLYVVFVVVVVVVVVLLLLFCMGWAEGSGVFLSTNGFVMLVVGCWLLVVGCSNTHTHTHTSTRRI